VPTYAYACTACGHRFEVQQSFTDSALTECPECAGRLRKLFNTVGIVFKGSGFYRTDSRASGSGSGEKAADGAVKADAPSKDGSKDGSKDASKNGSKDSGSKDSGSSTTSTSSPAGKAASSAA
jgi:putative FmdB family regulatory protein